MFVSAHMACDVCRSLAETSLLVITRQSEKQSPERATFRPLRFISATSITPLKSVYLWSDLNKFQVQGFWGFFLIFIWHMCHLLLRQWKWVRAQEFTALLYCFFKNLFLFASQSRGRFCQWGIKSRYPRYPHQSACYYFIRLISGCLTPPSLPPSPFCGRVSHFSKDNGLSILGY